MNEQLITLKELRRAISALTSTQTHLKAALEPFKEVSPNLASECAEANRRLLEALQATERTLEAHKSQLERKEHEIYNYEGCVLQAYFTYKRFRYRLIVNKPDKRCEEPYLDNLQWQALLHLFGKETVDIDQIRVEKKYSVAVMNKYNTRIERMIPPLEQQI